MLDTLGTPVKYGLIGCVALIIGSFMSRTLGFGGTSWWEYRSCRGRGRLHRRNAPGEAGEILIGVESRSSGARDFTAILGIQ
ncbi:hypothetical protein BMI91_00240 [Thioclava sediminum]|uniref:Uncharacterized protein n=1 Tax=Thioclava sediminum TaxID=1915319 RepID=A0ABX3MYY0_9RHOB|nr:hypothetical protein BMI85_00145 [Thioclava sp. DLFJ4-1]OOY24914.1 hypothetical protein BMI91_00240 [Thioclava sediminum]